MSGENWLLVLGVLLIGAAAMFLLPQDVPVPVPPQVDAGPDVNVQESCELRLEGRANDPNGGPISVLWTVQDDHGWFADPTDPATIYTAPSLCSGAEIVELTLTVTTEAGLSAFDSLFACITNINHPPYADTGSDITVQEGATVRLTCSASDPDGDPISYHWAASNGRFDDPTQLHPQFTAPMLDCEAARSVTLTLTVTDVHGASASDSLLACVTNLNRAPCVDAGGDITVQEGATVRLTCSASDPDGDPVSCYWTAGSGRFDDPTLLHPQFTAPMLDCEAARSVTLTLTVTDVHGASASDSLLACVTNLNRAPCVDAGGDITVQEGATVRLTCSASDPDGDPVSCYWTAGSGRFDDQTLLHPQFTAPMLDCEAARNVTLTLIVTDVHGASASDSLLVYVTNVNHPPYADAGESFTMLESSIVQLACDGSDPDDDPVSYHWTATSGHFDNPCLLHPFYTSPLLDCESSRDVVVTLTVTDQHGASTSSSAVIAVQDRPEPECFPYFKLIVTEGERVRLSGRVTDPDSNLRRHLWQSSAGQFDDPGSLCTVFTAPLLEPGESLREIEVALVAEDTCGLTSRDTRIILVVAAKQPPQVDAGPECLLADSRSVQLEGNVFDKDGRITDISWRITQGCATLSDASVRNPILLFCPDAVPGSEAVVVLTATDDEGNPSTDTIHVRLTPGTTEPCLGEGLPQGSDSDN